MRLLRGAARIHNLYALWFAGGNCQVRISDAPEKRATLLLKTVFVLLRTRSLVLPISPPRPFHAECHFIVEQYGQVGLEACTQNFVECKHGLCSEFASSALIRLGRIGETITQYYAAVGEGGQNNLMNMLRARSEHQRHLRQRRKARRRRMQEHFANLLARGRSAGFARHRYRDAMPALCARKLLDLRALPASVETFESNKFSAWRHVGMIAGRVVDGRYGGTRRETRQAARLYAGVK